jgi:hypothetical protein
MKTQIIIQVLQKCVEFFSLKEIFNIISLNKYFRDHFKDNQVAFWLGINYLSSLTQETVGKLLTLVQDATTINKLKDLFYYFTGIKINSVIEIPSICKYSKNLIQNPCRSSSFIGWVKKNGSNGWFINDNFSFKNNKSSFVSHNYLWASLSTRVDLPLVGVRRKVIAGCPVYLKSKFSGEAKIRLSVIDTDGKKRLVEDMAAWDLNRPSEVKIDSWKLLSLSLDVDDNDVKAKIKISARSENSSGDYRGPCFGYCYARIISLDTRFQ